jgi:hypothetical protein
LLLDIVFYEVIKISVIKSKRSVSNIEFLYNARNLEIYSIKKCTNFPKRYTFYISQPIANASVRIYELAKCGNSIYPTNQHEIQLRRDYFLKAKAELYSLISQVEVACELFNIENKTLTYWMSLINNEINLIKGVIKSDKNRYSNL